MYAAFKYGLEFNIARGFATGNVLPSIAVSQPRIHLIDRYSTGFSGSIRCMMQQGPQLNHDIDGIKRSSIIDFLNVGILREFGRGLLYIYTR